MKIKKVKLFYCYLTSIIICISKLLIHLSKIGFKQTNVKKTAMQIINSLLDA